jgi:predicted helicase
MTFEEYIQKIEADLHSGHATEHTYRGSLELLIESYGKGVDASNDPKHVACGAPDFIVEKGKVPLGYVETKDVGSDLDKVEKSDQMKRYLKALHNLVLTDYLEFRWYVNGERKLKLRLAEVGNNNSLVVNPSADIACAQLFRDFFATETPTVNNPRELAIRLAGVTHFIRERIAEALEKGEPSVKQALEQQYKTFVELLLPALTPTEFADLYAQTMTYGLFAAKLGAPLNSQFTFEDAYKYLRANPFLRRLFSDVGEQLDEIEIIKPYLKDIVSLLNRSRIDEILADFGRKTRTEDPVVHFYETFLATYDPKMRESRGVYYTPEPVVKFIVRAVDDLLKTRFNKPWGLADESVKVLDPAAGTGTFLYYVMKQIYDEVVAQRGQAGQWQAQGKAMLKRLFGFEILMAPYVMSHLKLGLLLKELGIPLEGKDDRVHVYLTNTLEEGIERAEVLAGLGSNIADESNEAAKVKKANDIMVVLGNPPYSANSANKGEWISNLVRDSYYPHDEIKEQNPKLLMDDYVKFIRYGELRICKTGYGILGFITNHAYLDNPTFRGLRKHLLSSFDEIYIYDLHGNSHKKETTPEGNKDENVFDIQQGVAIILAIKNPISSAGKGLNEIIHTKILHSSLWGNRIEKYQVLQSIDLNQVDWNLLSPIPPFYLFIPQNIDTLDEYNKYWRISELFLTHSTGVKSHRDDFVFDFSQSGLKQKINDFINSKLDDDFIRRKYGLADTTEWKMKEKRIAIREKDEWQNSLIKCTYRPFDNRFLIFDPDLVDRSRQEVFKHSIRGDNLSLLFMRQVAIDEIYSHFFVSDYVIDNRAFFSNKGACSAAPLYLFETQEDTVGTLFSKNEIGKRPNFTREFLQRIKFKLELQFIPEGRGDLRTSFGPEDVFYYMYAIFHSPTYRTRYAEFLKIDFPRLPLTSDKKLFANLVGKGKELVDLHLLKSAKIEKFITTYPVSGDNKVEKVGFANGKVFINSHQYFGGVPEEVWNFKIGGYQVCDKWLKDRKGRVLGGEDISHYQRVVVALKETIRLMKEIDKAIPKWPIE